MAVLSFVETVESRSIEVSAREPFKYARSFIVQVDKPDTPLLQILAAPGVQMYQAHPEDNESKALKFSAKPRGSSLLLYEVQVDYDKPPPGDENTPPQNPGGGGGGLALPGVVWSGGTTLDAVPCVKAANGDPIANSAGVPFPDAEKKEPAVTLSCTKPYLTYAGAAAAGQSLAGKCNNGAWAGGADHEWMCTGFRWAWKSETSGPLSIRYVEAQFEFTWKRGGWYLDLIDKGFMESVDGNGDPQPYGPQKKAIKDKEGKPVKEPVYLNGQGGVMTPPPSPGRPPFTLRFEVYEVVNFDAWVGGPQ